ncbi:lysosomal cystine transporter [Colletotrichum musicola]|uniref:Lysosomal cystine transporter n=1 Tax=Colletotrichum musicola TaxID=2175873 RepID=A0A8H6UAC3_9PEZI|nr:lysosomal cystine transporter [Colletotrichum musicola]
MAFEFLPFLSAAFGWIYFLCWSGSFYPQPLLNFTRKTTAGTTVDFPLINCLAYVLTRHLAGFLAYFISNSCLYYSPLVRSQYAARNHGLTPTVAFNDITFAAHALLLSCITTSQYFPKLWGFAAAPGTKPSRFISGIAFGCVVGVAVVSLIVAAAPSDGDPRTSWCALDIVYAISYVKLVITLIKYTPQVITNYRNRSTKGWSIWQILLDFSGGLLSCAQQAIDSYLQHDWSGITGNPVKFALGNVSMAYDVVFMTQHYILYRGSEGKADERDSLLRTDDEEHQRLD